MGWGRTYFAVQAIAGAAWWVGVFTSSFVRETTLGSLDPVVVALFDIPLFVVASAVAAIGLCLVLLGRVPLEWIVRGPFAFRAASLRPGSAGYIATTVAQIVFFWGFFLVVLPLVIVLLEQRWQLSAVFPQIAWPAGVALLALASLLGLSSAFVMSTRGKGTPLPSAMLLSSWLVVTYAVVGSVLWNYAVRPSEEADLEKRFGAEFQQYRSAVRCWIPRLLC